MRYAISGGAGFIGTHLCHRLLDEGHEVLVLDNGLTSREENVASLRSRERLTLQTQDVSNPFEVSGDFDRVLHLASPASPADFPAYPIQIVKVGTLGTHNMLGLARSRGARFLLASTSEVYGDPLVHPQPEGYWGNVNPIGPRGCYDEAKRCAEAFTMAYHRAHGIDTRIIRIFNTYGPGMRTDDGRVIPNFVSQALAGEPLTVFGDGTQTRSLCFVDDLVSGLLAVLEHGDSDPYNVGNPDEMTMAELAGAVIRVADSTSAVEYRPLPVDDPRQRRPDITRLTALGWQPTVALEPGLRRTVDYFAALRR